MTPLQALLYMKTKSEIAIPEITRFAGVWITARPRMGTCFEKSHPNACAIVKITTHQMINPICPRGERLLA